jgi:hypothetical protein
MNRMSPAVHHRPPHPSAGSLNDPPALPLDVLRVDLTGSLEGPTPVRRRPASPELEQQLSRILSPQSVGSMGSTIQLPESPPITVDWLRLGKANCFVVFAHSLPPAADCALFLSRLNPHEDEAHLAWFTQEVLPGIYGRRGAADAVAKAGAWPSTLMVIVGPNLLNRGRTAVDVIERQFGLHYLRENSPGSLRLGVESDTTSGNGRSK